MPTVDSEWSGAQGGGSERRLEMGVGSLNAGSSPVTNCCVTRDEPRPSQGRSASSSFSLFVRTACLTVQGRQRRKTPDIKPLTWAEDDTARHTMGRKSSKACFCPWRANSTVKQTKHKKGNIHHQLKVSGKTQSYWKINTELNE